VDIFLIILQVSHPQINYIFTKKLYFLTILNLFNFKVILDIKDVLSLINLFPKSCNNNQTWGMIKFTRIFKTLAMKS